MSNTTFDSTKAKVLNFNSQMQELHLILIINAKGSRF